MEQKIITFIKAVDKRYFESFLENGEICMNTADWFRKYENEDSNIGDKFEGSEIVCGKNFTISVADPIKAVNTNEEVKNELNSANWLDIGKGIDLRLYYENDYTKIYSLYAITSNILNDKTSGIISKRFTDEFSNHRFILFLNPDEFLSKIKVAISNFSKSIHSGKVNYYELNEELLENLNYFHKPDKYSYQNEFRIIFEDDNPDKRIFRIGALNEICMEIDINRKYSIALVDDEQFSIQIIE